MSELEYAGTALSRLFGGLYRGALGSNGLGADFYPCLCICLFIRKERKWQSEALQGLIAFVVSAIISGPEAQICSEGTQVFSALAQVDFQLISAVLSSGHEYKSTSSGET